MKRAVGWILLGVSLLLAYQGYGNAQLEPETEALAQQTLCASGSVCPGAAVRPREIRTDVIQRRYWWAAQPETEHVLCRRELVFFGGWSCTIRPSPIGE